MRKFFPFSLIAAAVLTCAAALFSGQAWAQQAVAVDRVVAVVNNAVITEVELRNRMRQVVEQLNRQGIQLPPEEVLERQVLERLILERAQIQLAEETGLRVDEATLERAVARIAENNQLSEAELRAALDNDGISWARFREEIRTEVLLSRLREREVDSRVVVTDAEIDMFLANNPEAFSGREFLIAHILVRAPESPVQADIDRINAKAQEVMRRLEAGEDFGQVAAAFSDAPDALEGGSIGWRGQDRLPGLFAEAIRDMQPGDVSPVMRSAAGLHVVKLVDVRGGALADAEKMEQTRARHILLRTSEVLSDDEAASRLRGLRERVIHGEDFAELAKAHSVDLSAAKGGDLGWLYPGDTVPQFERAMDALAPGEVSEAVRSPFGWHLIEVLERRVQDVTDERRRNVARAALRQRKGDEAYEEWLREMRDSTYVEYRLERE